MITEVFFDIETKKLFGDLEGGYDPTKLGVSIVSVYYRTLSEDLLPIEQRMMSFWEEQFPDMWDMFERADRIIGFNTLGFDVPVLAPYAPKNFARLKHFDLMDIFRKTAGHRISLDALCKDTLGAQKNDSGINAVAYWNAHDEESLRKLQFYCEHDVALTRDLYDFGYQHKIWRYTDKWNNPKSIPIDLSYPPEKLKRPAQIGLF